MSTVGLGAIAFHAGFSGPTGGGGRGAGCVLVIVPVVGEFPFDFDVVTGERPFNVVDLSATPRVTPLGIPLGNPFGTVAEL